MVFESESVTGDDGAWVVDGQLTIKGTTQPLQLATVLTGQRVFPLDEKLHTGFVADGRLSRVAFGVAPEIPDHMLSDDIQLDIAAQLIAD